MAQLTVAHDRYVGAVCQRQAAEEHGPVDSKLVPLPRHGCHRWCTPWYLQPSPRCGCSLAADYHVRWRHYTERCGAGFCHGTRRARLRHNADLARENLSPQGRDSWAWAGVVLELWRTCFLCCLVHLLRMADCCGSQRGHRIRAEHERRIMYELDHFLCGGNTGFVSRTMPSTGRHHHGPRVRALRHHAGQNVRGKVTGGGRMDTRSRRAVLTVVGATTTEYANTFGTCWDLEGDGFTNPFIPLLMEDYKLDRRDCGSLSHLCSASDSSTVRMVCPETCGCDHPRASLFLSGAAFGCPRVSCTAKDQYMVELENISCSTSNVQAPADWTDFVVHWDTHWAESGTSDGTVKSHLLAHGCDAVQSYQAILCVETSASMGFSMWCPVQCGCRVPNGGYQDFRQVVTSGDRCTKSLSQICHARMPQLGYHFRLFLVLVVGAPHRLRTAFFSLEAAIMWWLMTEYGCSALPVKYCGVSRTCGRCAQWSAAWSLILFRPRTRSHTPNTLFLFLGTLFFGAHCSDAASNVWDQCFAWQVIWCVKKRHGEEVESCNDKWTKP